MDHQTQTENNNLFHIRAQNKAQKGKNALKQQLPVTTNLWHAPDGILQMFRSDFLSGLLQRSQRSAVLVEQCSSVQLSLHQLTECSSSFFLLHIIPEAGKKYLTMYNTLLNGLDVQDKLRCLLMLIGCYLKHKADVGSWEEAQTWTEARAGA